MKDRIESVDRILRKGIYSLCESLYTEWPLHDKDPNEIAEANLTIHVAHAFLSQQYCVYAESPIHSYTGSCSRGLKHDLVMFQPGENEYIVVECKRFLKTDKSSLLPDLNRMHEHWPNNPHPAIGIACFMTRDVSIQKWWMHYGDTQFLSSRSAEEWSGLTQYLQKWQHRDDVLLGHIPLPHHGDGDGFYHEALYAIFVIK